MAPDREREPERIFRIETTDADSIRKGTDIFDVPPPEPTDASPADAMASLVPKKIAEPKDQVSSE